MSAPAAEQPGLTFQWRVESGFPFALFVCVAGSIIAHAATFFLFQVVYPQRVTIPQSAPRLSLLTATSPENISLLRWIEAEDPALIASDSAAPPPPLVEVRYRPSFAAPRTAPLGPPVEKPVAVRFPPAIDRLKPNLDSTKANVSAPALRSSTSISFSDALSNRAVVKIPPLRALGQSTAPVDSTVILAGVNQVGAVRYEVLQQSSGDPALDELALAHLRQVTFAPAESPMTWAHVVFAWGGDAYSAVKPTKSAPARP